MTSSHHFQWRYDHWKKSPEALDPYERNISVEICETSTGVTFRKEEIQQEDIPGLCERSHSSPDTKWSLRLLVTPRRYSTDATYRVPYSFDSMQALERHWHIPTSYIPHYHPSDASAMSFSPILGDSDWKGLLLILPSAESCSLTITYNLSTKETFVVCAACSEGTTDRLLRRLESSQDHASHPFLFPIMVISCIIHELRDDVSAFAGDYRAVSSAMGCNESYAFDPDFEVAPALNDMPRKLTELTGRIADHDFSTSSMLHIMDRLEQLFTTLPSDYNGSSIGVELQEQARFMRQRIANMKHWNDFMRGGTQSLVQMVYAVLQQRDNEVNHRYGADMRLITAITLIFLPGTFVATFFSSSFWDFTPDNTGDKVSSWVWLYCVVTVALTLMVLSVWRGYTVLKQFRRTMVLFWRENFVRRRLRREEGVDDREEGVDDREKGEGA